jgi:hypothetical protein
MYSSYLLISRTKTKFDLAKSLKLVLILKTEFKKLAIR